MMIVIIESLNPLTVQSVLITIVLKKEPAMVCEEVCAK